MRSYCQATDPDHDDLDHHHVCWLLDDHPYAHVCRCYWVWVTDQRGGQ